jgi:hypothetical protein
MEVEERPQKPIIELTQFSLRHFGKKPFGGTTIPMDPKEFLSQVNSQVTLSLEVDGTLKDGYAPFCKHLWVPNFTGARAGVIRITDENRKFLRSGYEARQEGELPVLTRWFEDIVPGTAAYLDIILYSQKQLAKEAKSSGNSDTINSDWGVVAINAETARSETPMDPNTILRNALGKSQGGSGVPLDNDKYAESVKFWTEHARVKTF